MTFARALKQPLVFLLFAFFLQAQRPAPRAPLDPTHPPQVPLRPSSCLRLNISNRHNLRRFSPFLLLQLMIDILTFMLIK